jgi:putative glycosyltransferase (TIGR04372 family)
MGDDYGGVALQADIQSRWEEKKLGPLLVLKDTDQERGWDCLRHLGVPKGIWFAALHVREGKSSSRAARDADISSYTDVIRTIVEKGGWVIRMGDSSMTPLPPMPQVIDYAHSKIKSDWMDVFLWANCRFFIGTQSGPAWVPPTFGVPCVATNWTFFSRRWFGQDLFIPKLFWSQTEKRHLTFDESINSHLSYAESLDYLSSRDIVIVNNSAEDINNVVIEMIEKLENELEYTDEDEYLQKRFNEIAGKKKSYRANARIGRVFLRKWQHLL